MSVPSLDLFWVMQTPLIYQCVFVVAKLGIADLLNERPRSASELAEELGVSEAGLLRVLRGLAAVGLLRRDETGSFCLTEKLAPLCSDAPVCLRHWVLLMREIAWSAGNNLLEAVQTGDFAFEIAHGKSCWALLEENDELRELFDQGMGTWTTLHAPAVVAACDLSQTRELVDIGGGRGTLLVALLKANPHLRGIVFDRPEAVPVGRKYIADAGLAERCQMVGGDFLSWVPPSETYIIKHALHDWADEFAVKVLKTIRASIKPNGRLLIVDAVMEERAPHQPMVSMLDLSQMVTTTGRVRTRRDFRVLLASAGFSLQRVTPSRLSDVNILECAPVEVAKHAVQPGGFLLDAEREAESSSYASGLWQSR